MAHEIDWTICNACKKLFLAKLILNAGLKGKSVRGFMRYLINQGEFVDWSSSRGISHHIVDDHCFARSNDKRAHDQASNQDGC